MQSNNNSCNCWKAREGKNLGGKVETPPKTSEGISASPWGEKTRAEDTEEWALGYFSWRKKKKTNPWLLLAPFSGKVRSESSSHRILCNHTVSNLSDLISPLYICGRGRPLPVLSLGLRDFLSVRAVPTNCIMINGGLNIVRARRRGTSDSVVTNFDSTPKQPEQHDNDQGLSAFVPMSTYFFWDRNFFFFFLVWKTPFKKQRFLKADQLD